MHVHTYFKLCLYPCYCLRRESNVLTLLFFIKHLSHKCSHIHHIFTHISHSHLYIRKDSYVKGTYAPIIVNDKKITYR